MINNKQELFAAIKDENIPLDPGLIWNNVLSEDVKYTCESPELLFEAFVKVPEMFPKSEQLLILWSTNSNSIVGYLRNDKKFIRYYPEDGPGNFEVLGSTYQQMISDLFRKLISRGKDKKTLQDLANTFNFNYLDELIHYVQSDDDWEENTGSFIGSIES